MGIDCSVPLQWLAKLLIPLGLIGKATDFTNVSYENYKGKTLHAYLKYPPNFNASQSYPAALVFHAWNGMSEEPVYFADLLAKEGFIVLAPDLLRNVATGEANLPWNILSTCVTPQSRMDEDIDAAIHYLTHTIGNVDMTRVFSGPGFCFGGSQALNLAIRRPMAGTISLYGSNIDELQDSSKDKIWANLGAGGTSVLGIYGADDNMPAPETAMGFEEAMNTRGISNTVTIYPDVGHAFVNPADHSSGKQQAVDAWNQVVDFIKDQAGVSRRILDVSEAPAQLSRQVSRPALSWLWDHAMDYFYGKGHFAHAHGAGHKSHSYPMAEASHQAHIAVKTSPATSSAEHQRNNHKPNVRVGRAN